MTQEAVVTKIMPAGMAEILVKRESACGGNCHACGGTCSIKNNLKVSAKNGVLASVGDRVVVSSSTKSILTAAFIVYILPVVLFFLFYAAAAIAGASESSSVIISLVGFFGGVGIAVALNRWFKNKEVTTFEIVSIL